MPERIDEGISGKESVEKESPSAEAGEVSAKSKGGAGISVYENLTVFRDEYRREPRFI